MATFFKKWFGKSAADAPPDTTDAAPAPAAGRKVYPMSFQYQRPELVRNFLEYDWRKEGHQDALHFPSLQRRDSRLQSIIADYRHRLQSVQAQLQSQVHELEMHLLEVQGIDLVMESQIKHRMRQLQSMHTDIEKQLELSVDHEGWLVPVMIAYKDGFLTGTRQYQHEADLLGGVNTLL